MMQLTLRIFRTIFLLIQSAQGNALPRNLEKQQLQKVNTIRNIQFENKVLVES